MTNTIHLKAIQTSGARRATSKYGRRCFRLILGCVVFLSTLPALASIPRQNAFQHMEMIDSQTKELNLSLLANIQMMLDGQKFNMTRYIPLQSMPQEADGAAVAEKILKHSMQTLIDDIETAANVPENIRNLSQINNALSTSMDRQSYSISFKLRPVDTKAIVSYKGYVEAALSYDVSQSETQLEVSKRVGEQTYAYTIKDSNSESSNTVGVRWNF